MRNISKPDVDIRKALDANIPQDVIATRQGGGGKSLSYLETWYVIDRLNQVLGQGNWSYSSEVTKVFEGKSANSYGEVFATSYIAQVSLEVNLADDDGYRSYAKFTDYGYGDGTDKTNPGKAHELAVKEAVSDGLKRAAKNLGRSMGLALYDKTQEFVGDSVVPTKAESAKAISTIEKTSKAVATKLEAKLGVSNAKPSLAKPTKETIGAAFKVLEAQGKVDKETFKTKYLASVGLSKLTDADLINAITKLRQDFPALNL